ncbi:MAG: hypothetical protein HND58_04975 [Planctomycetota bacterium]|nr:MAG: hypothetical protein HND58_04975 [Planctomycetota bacterium]
MKKIITGIVIVAAFLIGMAIFLTQRESAFSAHWHDQVSQRIQRLDDYSLHAAHYDRWFDARHDDLFSANYSTFSGFDGEAYLAKIFNTTADLAAAEGFTEQADSLRNLHGTMLYQPE